MTVTQDLQKRWQTVTFKDNFVFGKTLELFPDLCLQVVEMITNFKIKHISYPEREKTIDARIDSKGIRLDVFVEDEHNRSFDLEMQISNAHDLLKRTRYYQGLIDLEKLKKGNHYSSLGESFIIFICPFQLFGQNQHKYIWQTKCINNPNISDTDGVTKIFLSTKGSDFDISTDLLNFLQYVDNSTVSDNFTNRLNCAVEMVKSSEKVRLDFMTFQMALLESKLEGEEIGREKGRAEGREEERMQMVQNLLLANTPIEFISKATGWSKDKLLKITQSLDQNKNL